jgi:uncharacterized membrane protein YvbJ
MTPSRDIKILVDRLNRESHCGSIIGREWKEAVENMDKEKIKELLLLANDKLLEFRSKHQ